MTYSTENWTVKFSENSLRSIAKKILSVKINAVQFSTLIYLDVYFELFYLRISYLRGWISKNLNIETPLKI